MHPRITVITLGVKNLEDSVWFLLGDSEGRRVERPIPLSSR